jgi:hypothetical protein
MGNLIFILIVFGMGFGLVEKHHQNKQNVKEQNIHTRLYILLTKASAESHV